MSLACNKLVLAYAIGVVSNTDGGIGGESGDKLVTYLLPDLVNI